MILLGLAIQYYNLRGDFIMKIKPIIGMGLAMFLTLAFSATAFAATPSTSVVTQTPSTIAVSQSTITPMAVSTNIPPAGYYGFAHTTATVNVRSGPASTDTSYCTYPANTPVYVSYTNTNGWCTVRYNTPTGGQFAYISANYLYKDSVWPPITR